MLNIKLDQEQIGSFCSRWRITEFALFGSVLREDFRPDSDVDALVTFDPEAHLTLFDLAEMQDELSHVLGRAVDVVSRRGVEASENHLRRQSILESAHVIYAA